MKQKSLFLQAMPFVLVLAILSVSRIVFELTYSNMSYVITTSLACVLSIGIMSATLVKCIKAKAYVISALSSVAIILLLVKLIIAAFSVKFDFDFPISTFEIIYVFLLLYFFATGVMKKNVICLFLTFLATASYLIIWCFPNLFISLRDSIGFNTYFNSHEMFVVIFGWVILLAVSVISHLFYKGNKGVA